jgi:hypothetical protein
MAIDYFKIGQISGKQFTDVTGAVEKGLEAGFKPLVEWQKKRDKFDADYARLLQSTPNIDNLPELPSNYLPKASEWLISKQQEYAANARTTIKARPGSPEYQQAVMNMNNIKSSVANLKSNLTGINTERKEFLKSKEIGEISLGFQNADIYEAYGPNGAITAIDANGNVALTGDGGKSFNWNERQEFFNKSGGVQKDLFLAGDISLKEGEAGKQRNIDYYTEKSKAIVAQYDLPKIKSLVFDDLDGTDTKLAEDTGLVSLINSPTPNLPEIRQALASKLGRAFFDVNAQGFKTYSDKQAKALDAKQSRAGRGSLTDSQKAETTAAEVFNMVIQDPVAYAKTKLRGNFKEGKGTIITLVMDGQDKKFDLKRGDQFMEFMDIVTKNSNQLSGTSASTQAAGRKFYDIILNARNTLNAREEGFQQMKKQYLPQFFSPETLSDLPTTFN